MNRRLKFEIVAGLYIILFCGVPMNPSVGKVIFTGESFLAYIFVIMPISLVACYYLFIKDLKFEAGKELFLTFVVFPAYSLWVLYFIYAFNHAMDNYRGF